MNTSIYVCGHRPFMTPVYPIYKKLQVGAALHEDLGYIRDDAGDNISKLNPCFSELTGMYWIWKNDRESDIKGLCHYRRYFINADGHVFSESDYEKMLKQGDIIVPLMVDLEKSCRDFWGEVHHTKDFEVIEESLKRVFPSYAEVFDSVVNDTKMYIGNLCCMKSELFNEYSEWLFSILLDAYERLNITDYDPNQKRVCGFAGERLLRVWIEGKGCKPVWVNVGCTAEKTEITAIKEQVAVLIGEGRVVDAMEKYISTLEERPDLLAPDSDVLGSLSELTAVINDIGENPQTIQEYLNIRSFDELIKRAEKIKGAAP